MTIAIRVGEHLAKVATMTALYYGREVNSPDSFRNEVGAYIARFGKSCIEDHELEAGDFEKLADAITKKYWR